VSWPLLSVTIAHEHDVVTARQRARHVAGVLGFDAQEQTRVATAVSEIARNAFRYAGGGKVEFSVEGRTSPQVLVVKVSDSGPGIAHLQQVLEGRYRSQTGLGLGIVGARRLMDQFAIESARGQGTTVWLRKLFPSRAPFLGALDLAQAATALVRQRPQTPLEEVIQQNQELLGTLQELKRRQDEMARLNQELADTNRGVVALYAELDEKADHLRRADEMKSRFLSNMSHEFRTPLNSILALSRLLLDGIDGPLTGEQTTQVGFIRKAAEDLSELVNDLLDLAKVEAGKVVVRPIEFEVANLFGALRGMLRPLLVNDAVTLVFDDPAGLPPLYTDEAKVSQILRNFISNALKFTERGEVRVSAALAPAGETVVFTVSDTGIGIAPEDQERIFEEFSQLDHPIQKRVKGTGLGLPLAKRLAGLLGGRLSVVSEPGVGSTFSAAVPRCYVEPEPFVPMADWEPQAGRVPVLVVEDRPDDVLVYAKFLRDSPYQPVHARSVREARHVLAGLRPRAIVLDIVLKGEDTWAFLAALKHDEDTRGIPVIVATTLEDHQKGLGLGADAYGLKPFARPWLLDALDRLTRRQHGCRVLVVDDDEVWRYLLRGALVDARYVVSEAATASEGLERAFDEHPDVVVLDLVMPDMTGFDVLDRLRANARTTDIPVVVATSKPLDDAERTRLSAHAAAVVAKDSSGAHGTLRVLATLGLVPPPDGGHSG
jgi:signal transduction histidine kinase/CheY-like chemotaxis protein